MSTLALLGIGAGSIALLLLLIIRWQVHAFVAMMLVNFLVAFATGMPIGDIISTLIAGMAARWVRWPSWWRWAPCWGA